MSSFRSLKAVLADGRPFWDGREIPEEGLGGACHHRKTREHGQSGLLPQLAGGRYQDSDQFLGLIFRQIPQPLPSQHH
jgi:hypothetical protein